MLDPSQINIDLKRLDVMRNHVYQMWSAENKEHDDILWLVYQCMYSSISAASTILQQRLKSEQLKPLERIQQAEDAPHELEEK